MNPTDADERIVAALAPAHSSINASHAHARTALLTRLADEPSLTIPRRRRTLTLRYVAGGLGLGTLAATVALALWLFSPVSPAAAMERMAKALDQISGYTYLMDKKYVSRAGEGRTVRQVTNGSWRTSPAALRATMQIYELSSANTANAADAKKIVELEESHQANKGGILIDHLKKEFWYVNDGLNAGSIPPSSPQVAVYMVQQRRGKVLKDLGMKRVRGQDARGLEIMLDNAQPVSELGPTVSETKPGEPADFDWRNAKFEVWIDPKTNLPIDFRCVRRGDDFETTYEFYNLNWNVDFAEDAFDLTPPADYTERKISPETDSQ
jgi:hypothetical protein